MFNKLYCMQYLKFSKNVLATKVFLIKFISTLQNEINICKRSEVTHSAGHLPNEIRLFLFVNKLKKFVLLKNQCKWRMFSTSVFCCRVKWKCKLKMQRGLKNVTFSPKEC